MPDEEAYFFSSDFIGSVVADAAPLVPPLMPVVPPAVLLAAPVPVVASAPGAGVAIGVVGEVSVVVEEDDEAAGALGAGGGVVTIASSFLQAVRPTATRAAITSERFMFLPYRRR
jgi:hypothetical protein